MPMDADYGFNREQVRTTGSQRNSADSDKKIADVKLELEQLKDAVRILAQKVEALEAKVSGS